MLRSPAAAPYGGAVTGSSALLTDRYELTMLQATLADGTAHRRCVFELFTRRLPAGRRYGVLAGTGRLLEELEHFRFGDEELSWLSREKVVDRPTLDWRADYRFRGSVRGYAEGETYFPHSPVLVVEGTFAEAVVIETLALSILNYDTEDEAIEIANDTPFGLAGFVQSGDPARARRVANRIRAGRVYYNGAAFDRSLPFGGYKQSGNGREFGLYGFREYLEVKALLGFPA